MEKTWWKEAVVYQVYPRSFQDSNNDGIGDIQGIRQRLDYLKALGVDVIWLNPVYASPNDDMGYDISDYEAIMAEFGTMADFDELLEDIHAHGMKLVMDLVVNHTSDEHQWFIESRKGKDNAFRDYYIWHDPVDGHEPNDWRSAFSGPAWQFDEKSGQYYLHLFSKKQPDLNWRNPAVRQDVYDMMTRWLQKGVDGFRMDVINKIAKPEPLANTNISPDNGALLNDYLQEMNRKVLSKFDVMTVGEMGGTTPEQALDYTGFDRHELNMIFQFEHMDLDADKDLGKWRPHAWKLSEMKRIMSKWQTELNGRGWNSLYWNNHDQPRVVSRFGNDSPEYRVASAKMLGAVLHYMQGTPYIFQGEELGMTNVANFTKLSDFRDIETLNAYRELVEEQHKVTPEAMMAAIHHSSRDNARTPMQWDDSANAGFTGAGVTPWIGLNENYKTINVAEEAKDPQSVLAFYTQMNALRKQYPVITYGDYTLVDPEDEQVWQYRRQLGDTTLTLVANFTDQTVTRPLGDLGTLIQQNYTTDAGDSLRPYEVKVYVRR